MAGLDRRSRTGLVAAALALGPATAVAQPVGASGQAPPNAVGQDASAQNQGNRNEQGQSQNSSNQSRQSEQGEKSQEQRALKLAVLKLKHADPQQISNLLRALDQPTHHTVAFRGNSVPAGASASAGGGEQRPPLLIAADGRSKSIFVRGEQRRLDEVLKLVETLDTEGDLHSTQFSDARIIPVRNANHGEVLSILQQLQLPATAFQVGNRGVVVIRGDDQEELSQAEQVIQAIDQKQDQSGQDQGSNAPKDRGTGNQNGQNSQDN